MCYETVRNSTNADDSRNEKSFFDFRIWEKQKLPTDQKYLWREGRVKRSVWFSSIGFSFNIENWKSKIYNLRFQFLFLRKVKLKNNFQYFENQKLKIENGQSLVFISCC